MRIASRISNLGTETAFEVLARAKALEAAGKDVIHLEIGEPDFATPPNIIEAAKRALDEGWTHYGPSAGLPQAREAIAAYFNKTRSINKYSAENVVITPGAKPIIFFGLQALIEPGDEVIYPNPGFPIYESVIRFLGAIPVSLPLREENDFRLNISDLEARLSPRTKMVIINTPHNPTGSVLTFDDLSAIAELSHRFNFIVFSDEIYSQITYDAAKHISITQFEGMEERTIVLDGFSKTFAMTGWRLGYGIMPTSLAKVVSKLQTNCTSCAPSFTQIAGIEALTERTLPYVNSFVEEFKRRRNAIVEGLNSIPGVQCRTPQGAFYAFANIKATGMRSQEYAEFMLEKVGVACLSGTAFGSEGEGFVRFSYANSLENIEKAIQRMKLALEERILTQ
ncbi:MAG: pyridoxal phosphate-dependent aminotransferase [Bacteroidota bacterium]|nr:pyridoxal phosphate-dependent aminotransferase [Candidatus Kapabacteria bacterium]MCS7302641.1 pyridoxal phosphate-dependent aminotransferase [Candidatus Kapabacteria bacterium]MCX7936244.1 pyridoxal phosphate-dependent aminotransferase [Chlorobiota bacterium]MDW8074475.1 pyridoxal phosphate-dependent aminotransferase [Bacteroidota bacterium]MDW8271049.1 pyridoxal phosphate-dependent aminotransferase [Bacteroidota bacterium]